MTSEDHKMTKKVDPLVSIHSVGCSLPDSYFADGVILPYTLQNTLASFAGWAE